MPCPRLARPDEPSARPLQTPTYHHRRSTSGLPVVLPVDSQEAWGRVQAYLSRRIHALCTSGATFACQIARWALEMNGIKSTARNAASAQVCTFRPSANKKSPSRNERAVPAQMLCIFRFGPPPGANQQSPNNAPDTKHSLYARQRQLVSPTPCENHRRQN